MIQWRPSPSFPAPVPAWPHHRHHSVALLCLDVNTPLWTLLSLPTLPQTSLHPLSLPQTSCHHPAWLWILLCLGHRSISLLGSGCCFAFLLHLGCHAVSLLCPECHCSLLLCWACHSPFLLCGDLCSLLWIHGWCHSPFRQRLGLCPPSGFTVAKAPFLHSALEVTPPLSYAKKKFFCPIAAWCNHICN